MKNYVGTVIIILIMNVCNEYKNTNMILLFGVLYLQLSFRRRRVKIMRFFRADKLRKVSSQLLSRDVQLQTPIKNVI